MLNVSIFTVKRYRIKEFFLTIGEVFFQTRNVGNHPYVFFMEIVLNGIKSQKLVPTFYKNNNLALQN